MSVKLLYFAWLRERLDVGEEHVELPPTVVTLSDLFEWQRRRDDSFAELFKNSSAIRVAMNQEHVSDLATPIGEAEEIAFFPPMTGG